jgi:hypothetical protein
MDEKLLILMEKYFENDLSESEKVHFDYLLSSDQEFKREFEEQNKMKEVFRKMKFINPSDKLWDIYWEKSYNRTERGLGWLAVFLGLLILIGFASIEFVNQLYADNSTPVIIKIGTVSLVFGLLVLLFSVLREKLFTYKNDRYKEIKR